MADYSLAILVGKLVDRPMLDYSARAGEASGHMAILVRRETSDGPKETTVAVATERHQAELCHQILRKGSTVMVVGSIIRGASSGDLFVRADRVQFLDKQPAEVRS